MTIDSSSESDYPTPSDNGSAQDQHHTTDHSSAAQHAYTTHLQQHPMSSCAPDTPEQAGASRGQPPHPPSRGTTREWQDENEDFSVPETPERSRIPTPRSDWGELEPDGSLPVVDLAPEPSLQEGEHVEAERAELNAWVNGAIVYDEEDQEETDEELTDQYRTATSASSCRQLGTVDQEHSPSTTPRPYTAQPGTPVNTPNMALSLCVVIPNQTPFRYRSCGPSWDGPFKLPALDQTATKDFDKFIMDMIDMTARKLTDKKAPAIASVSDQWLYYEKHLLGHFAMDTPFLELTRWSQELKAESRSRAIAAGIMAHILFCKMPGVLDCIRVRNDGRLWFDEEAALKLVQATPEDSDDTRQDQEVESTTCERSSAPTGTQSKRPRKDRTGNAELNNMDVLTLTLTHIMDNMEPSAATRAAATESYRKKGAADKAGRGYSRSAFATIAKTMNALIDDSVGFWDWPHCTDPKAQKQAPYVPRVLLYIHHLTRCCQMLNSVEDNQVLQYFHLLFRCTPNDPSLVCFFGRRAFEHLVPGTAVLNSLSKERVGAPAYGYMGCGGINTVYGLHGRAAKPLSSCRSGYSRESVAAYVQLKELHSAKWQREAETKLGFHLHEFFSWGNFENMCCEKRKRDDYVLHAELTESHTMHTFI